MKFEIPVYVESTEPHHQEDLGELGRTQFMPSESSERRYFMHALFAPWIHAEGATLERTTTRMRQRLREATLDLSRKMRHEELGRLAFSPDVYERRLRLRVELRRRTVTGKYFFVAFRHLDRFLAFSPVLRDVWFELKSLKELESRANEVWREHLLAEEKKQEEDFEPPSPLQGSARITTVEFQRSTTSVRIDETQQLRAMLGGEVEMDGEEELTRVGRRLRDLYPGDLDRVVRYDPLVAELEGLLKINDRRPIGIIGPRHVGKTALLHEVVFRRMEHPARRGEESGHLWQLSPQRLISGMSYVGQWESRLHAILDFASARNHTLIFENALGLFQAGKSMQSSLTVGHLLKTAIQQRKCRVILEMTPEVFGRLRELDRSFVDLFHMLRMEEPNERETHLILIDTMRRLESRTGTQFGIRAVPAVYDLQRRFGRSSAFPGKACRALARLAVRSQIAPHLSDKRAPAGGRRLDRDEVLHEFREETGLPMALLDDAAALDEAGIRAQIGRRFVGQPEAMQAAVDVFGLLEARLNDPGKPIATMLLVGPTGVGKTQFAKELARCFFGSVDRLLRFDMNQFVGHNAATQLVGDFNQPEGLLTAAIRRQPFSVVLLDEIEKAGDDVHNMLLQVLGEGRLTDSLGRTCDFTNSILLLTSNLGSTHDTDAAVGFSKSEADDKSRVRRAVERFFRPEFVNRLDRTIIFDRLSRADMRGVARTLLNELFERPGLQQRRCLVDMDHTALDWLVDQGYDAAMGARAIRRAIESRLTSRVSEFLAAAPTDDHVTLVRAALGDGELQVSATLIEPHQPGPHQVSELAIDDVATVLEQLDAFVEARLEQIKTMKPDGAIETGKLSPETLRYYDVQDALQSLGQLVDAHWRSWEGLEQGGGKRSIRIPHGPTHRKGKANDRMSQSELAGDKNAAIDIEQFIRDVDEESSRERTALKALVRAAVEEAAWIDVLLATDVADLEETLELRWSAPAQLSAEETLFCGVVTRQLAEACGATWDHVLDAGESMELGWLHSNAMPASNAKGVTEFVLRGPAVTRLLAPELGWHFLGEGVSALELQGRQATGTTESPATGEWQRNGAIVRQYPRFHDMHLSFKDRLAASIPSVSAMRRMLIERLDLPREFLSNDREDVADTAAFVDETEQGEG